MHFNNHIKQVMAKIFLLFFFNCFYQSSANYCVYGVNPYYNERFCFFQYLEVGSDLSQSQETVHLYKPLQAHSSHHIVKECMPHFFMINSKKYILSGMLELPNGSELVPLDAFTQEMQDTMPNIYKIHAAKLNEVPIQVQGQCIAEKK